MIKTTFVASKVPKAVAPGKEQRLFELSDISTRINKTVGDGAAIKVHDSHNGDPYIEIAADKIHEVAKFLRDDEELSFTYPSVISATDFLPKAAKEEGAEAAPGRVELYYVLFSLKNKMQLALKVMLPRENPKIRSISDLFRAANWYERECFDMVGVEFEEHPYHKRVLLPEDWVGHPLRKDYVFPEEYNGMKVPL